MPSVAPKGIRFNTARYNQEAYNNGIIATLIKITLQTFELFKLKVQTFELFKIKIRTEE